MLRYGLPPDRMPAELLELDLAPLQSLGIDWRMGVRVGEDIAMDALKAEFGAVILAVGKVTPELPAVFGVQGKRNGIEAADVTHQTSDPRVFAGGDAVRATRRTVHSIADGRRMAEAADALLHSRDLPQKKRRFNSTIGCPHQDEMPVLTGEADPGPRIRPAGGPTTGYDDTEAAREARRCLHCECRKADNCRLRDYADAYDARGDRFPNRLRAPVERDGKHPRVLFEPGKCIKCSICLRVAEREGAPIGLAFLQRGYDVRVGTPFHASLQDALGAAAAACVHACPTAALAFHRLDPPANSTPPPETRS
jgi:ferredoxin